MKAHVVDPSAYTPPYDHALCSALAAAGVDVELYTSHFDYAELPPPDGYRRRELFYPLLPGGPASRFRRAAKLVEHVPDMLRYRVAARAADVVHFQWLAVPQIDGPLLPRGRPLVATAHDILARDATPGQHAAAGRLLRRFDAVIAHSLSGRTRLVEELGVAPERAHVIPHGAFAHLASLPAGALPPELVDAGGPVVLCFGLLRPYKGLEVLLDAWRGVAGARLWVVGMPRYDIAALRASAPANVDWVPRFVTDAELAACFRRAEIVVAPYLESEQSGVVATALAFGAPLVLTDVGGFREVAAAGAARLVAPADAEALRQAINELLADGAERQALASSALELAAGDWSWQRVAERTAALYRALL